MRQGTGIFLLLSFFYYDANGQCSITPTPVTDSVITINVQAPSNGRVTINDTVLAIYSLGPVNSGCFIYLSETDTTNWRTSVVFTCRADDTTTTLMSGDTIRVVSDDDGTIDVNSSGILLVRVIMDDIDGPIFEWVDPGMVGVDSIPLTCNDTTLTISSSKEWVYADGVQEVPMAGILGDCKAPLTWNLPKLTDNCGVDSLSVYFTAGEVAPDSLPNPLQFGGTSMDSLPELNGSGTVSTSFFSSELACNPGSAITYVHYYAVDKSGNVVEYSGSGCSASFNFAFRVEVVDDEYPEWIDPSDTISTNLMGEVAYEWNDTSNLKVVLSCNDPNFSVDLGYLVDTVGGAVNESAFIPLAMDNCLVNPDSINFESGMEGTFDCSTSTYDKTVNGLTYSPYAGYDLIWSAIDSCGNETPSSPTDLRFKLELYLIDSVGPYLGSDSTGVKTPAPSMLADANADTLVFTGDTIRFYTSGTYADSLPTCGVTVTGDTLALSGLDCQGITYSWEITRSVNNFSMFTALHGQTGTTGNPVYETMDSTLYFEAGMHDIVYTTVDDCGNVSTFSQVIEVIDNTPPDWAECPMNVVETNETGLCDRNVEWVHPVPSDNCQLDTASVALAIVDEAGDTITPTFSYNVASWGQTVQAEFPLGLSSIVYSITDLSGNAATCSFTVQVDDDEAPTAAAQNATVQLDADGVATVPAVLLDAGSSDQCSGLTYQLALDANGDGIPDAPAQDTLLFGCADTGTIQVVLLVFDAYMNSDTSATVTVTIEDDTPPVARCKNDTVYLDASGMASIMPEDLDDGSSDNCGNVTFEASETAFTCADVALSPVPVTLTVTDGSGNTASCNSLVSVVDTIAPVVQCTDTVVYLNAQGEFTITTSMVVDSTSDNCGPVTISLSRSVFDCDDLAGSPVAITVTAADPSGNESMCTSNITVLDDIGPDFDQCPLDITVYVSADSCSKQVFWDEPIFSDNCSVSSSPASSADPGDYFDLGTTTVQYFSSDGSSNTNSDCNFTVTVLDTISPTITLLQDSFYYYNEPGCEIENWDIPDGVVSVLDNCQADWETVQGLPQSFGLGVHTIIIIATDESNNESRDSVYVVVVDTIGPIVDPSDHTAYLNDLGQVTVDATANSYPFQIGGFIEDCGVDSVLYRVDIDGDGDFTNDGIFSVFQKAHTFDCSHLDSFTVEYKLVDESSNFNLYYPQLTILDTVLPTPVCVTSVDVYLDAAGIAWIHPADIDNGSFDNCTIVEYLVARVDSTFGDSLLVDCMDEVNMRNDGGLPIVLQVIDQSGNMDTCHTTAFVQDIDNPSLDCASGELIDDGMGISMADTILLATDPGVCAATRELVHPTPADNCGVDAYLLIISNEVGSDTLAVLAGDTLQWTFSGESVVTYYAADKADNAVSCTFEVHVLDDEAPGFVVCPDDVTISTTNEDNPGDCLGDYTWNHPELTDNCNLNTYTLTIGAGSPVSVVAGAQISYAFPIGETTLLYVVTDSAGNSNSCSQVITVVDDEVPSIFDVRSDVTLPNIMGDCFNNLNWTRPTFGDNCDPSLIITEVISDPGAQAYIDSIYPFSPGSEAFTAFPIGTTSVVYTVTDASGNVSVDSFTVTIIDNDAPEFFNCVEDNVPACPGYELKNYINTLTILDCSLQTAYQVPAPGTPLQEILDMGDIAPGTQFEVTVYAIDIFDNQDSCVITVTLDASFDPEPYIKPLPALTSACGEIYVEAPLASNCFGEVITAIPTNLPVSEYELVSTNPDVYLFTFLGVRNVIWYYEDPLGNNSEQAQSMTITPDVVAPELRCPQGGDAFTGFAGLFGPDNWTKIQQAPANGTITDGTAPDAITLTGTNYATCLGTGTQENYCITVTGDGTISFDWAYQSNDSSPARDPFGYSINGVFSQLTNNTGGLTQGGVVDVMLHAGDQFCFSQRSIDGCEGSGSTVVSNFVFSGILTVETDPGLCTVTDFAGLALSPGDGMEGLGFGEFYDACDREDQLTIEYVLSGATVSDTVLSRDAGRDTFNAGITTVTYIVTDRAGNSTFCSMLVKVEDREAPQFLVAALDTTVNCESVPDAPDMMVSDNCTPDAAIELLFSETVTSSLLSCDANYQIVRTWTATDQAGNVATLVQTLTVQDTTPPAFVTLPESVTFENDLNECGASLVFGLTDADASDNCSSTFVYSYNLPELGNLMIGNEDVFFYPVGITPVEATVTDECGNSTTQVINIEVLDVEPPIIGCVNNISFSLPPSNSLTITPSSLVQVLEDNCTPEGQILLQLSQSTFTCADADNMPIPVIITATDEHGNEAICKTDVTIQENVKPVAVCQDVTIALDFGGKATLDPALLDNGSTDNCQGTLQFASSQVNFECADLGEVPVILTVTDPSGNTDNCSAVVTVIDNLNPVAECVSINAYLGPDGTVTVAATDLDNGSTDNCTASENLVITINGFASITYVCSQKGPNSVTFVVEDENGNTDNCAAIITVIDTIAPKAVCKNMEVMLDGDQTITLNAADFDNGSSDQCDSPSSLFFSIDGSSTLLVDCNLFGETTIVLDVEDTNGNNGQCEATLTVSPLDNVTMIMGTAQGPYNDTVYVPITVENFFAVTSFQYSGMVEFDTVAILLGVEENPALLPANFQSNTLTNGMFTLSWYDVEGQTIADGDTIAWVKVLMVGEENALTPIHLSSDPLEAQVSQGCDPEAEPFLFSMDLITPGSVQVIENTVHKVGGTIVDDYGNPVCDVVVYVTGDVIDTLITDETGYYEFLAESGSNVCMYPYKNKRGKTAGGLVQPDILDALRIQTAVVTGNFGAIATPVKWLSADAQPNDGHNITVADAQRVQALVVSAITDFQPDHNFWNFVAASYALPVTNSNPVVQYPDSVCYLNVQEDKLMTDFIAFPMGDVTANQASSVMPVCDSLLFNQPTVNRDQNILEVIVTDQKLEAGQVYEIPFTVRNYEQIIAAQLTYRFDPMVLEYLGWQGGELPGFNEQNIGDAYLADGILGLGWFSLNPYTFGPDQELFRLVFRAKADAASLGALLNIDGTLAGNIAYNLDEEMYSFELVVESTTSIAQPEQEPFILYQNRPNPFNGLTVISFRLPTSDSGVLRIFDAAGKEVFFIEGDYNSGYNEVLIEANDLPAKGLYYYQLETSNYTASRRMILLE